MPRAAAQIRLRLAVVLLRSAVGAARALHRLGRQPLRVGQLLGSLEVVARLLQLHGERRDLRLGGGETVGLALVLAQRLLVDLAGLRLHHAAWFSIAFSLASEHFALQHRYRDRRPRASTCPFFTVSPSITGSSVIQPDTRLEIVTTSPSMRASSR